MRYWKNHPDTQFVNIFFYGFVPQMETEKYRNTLDILLAPYQHKVAVHGGKGDTSKWMSPLKIFECMASRKAIICSDLPVLREVLTDGISAVLCDPSDSDSWMSAIKRLKDSEELRK